MPDSFQGRSRKLFTIRRLARHLSAAPLDT
jgi:hypothetical protein